MKRVRLGPFELGVDKAALGLGKTAIQFAVEEAVGGGAATITKLVLRNVTLAKGEEETPEALVQLCVNRALVHAALEVFAEANKDGTRTRDLCNTVDPTVITLGDLPEEWIEEPESIPAWSLLERGVMIELREAGFGEDQARAFAGPLPDLFIIALADLWRWMKLDGDTPRALGVTPGLGPAAQRAKAWRKIEDDLCAWPDDPKENKLFLDRELFPEPFSIRDIYVDLRAYEVLEAGHGGMDADAVTRVRARDRKPKARQVDLMTAVTEWLEDEDGAPIRFVSGGPGCGKSTFARMLAAQTAADPQWRVRIVELHTVLKGGLWSAIVDRTDRRRGRARSMMDGAVEHRRLLLILDGLDELATLGSGGMDRARAVVEEISDELAGLPTVRALFLGRDLSVQTSELAAIGLRAATLHVMPLNPDQDFVQSMDWEGATPSDDLVGELNRRFDGWNVPTPVIPEDSEASEAIRDLLATPVTQALLVRYLAAHPNARDEEGRRGLLTSLNRATLYHDVLKDTHGRSWGRMTGQDLNALPHFGSFLRFMEDVALACFQDSTRTATVAAIAQLIPDQALRDDLRLTAQKKSAVPEQALLAFHVRFRGAVGDRRIEFTHKSFADYLLARRLLRAVREGEDLGGWAALFSAVRIEMAVVNMLRPEAARQRVHEGLEAEAARDHLANVLAKAVGDGYPVATLGGAEADLRSGPLAQRVADTDLAVLATLDALCRALDAGEKIDRASIDWPDDWAAWRMIGRQPPPADDFAIRYRLRPPLDPVRECLARLRYVMYTLSSNRDADSVAGGADEMTRPRRLRLDYANLEDANLEDANLRRADLWGANLQDANLRRADLEDANLQGANLEDADLWGANLEDADLWGANLQDANLEDADLWGANLRRADLQGANLQDATLRGANLQGANLEDADLQDANLEDADLRGANLQEATLRGANLQDANLEDADLRGTNLQDTNLEDADLRGANLEDANLRRADLRGANLEDVIDLGKARHLDTARLSPEMRETLGLGPATEEEAEDAP